MISPSPKSHTSLSGIFLTELCCWRCRRLIGDCTTGSEDLSDDSSLEDSGVCGIEGCGVDWPLPAGVFDLLRGAWLTGGTGIRDPFVGIFLVGLGLGGISAGVQ